jgi:hypothetical protein
MVDVAAVQVHVMEGSNVMVDRDRDGSNDQYRGEETKRRQEQPLAPRFYKPVLIDLPQPSVGNDRAKTTENRGNQDRQNPKAAVSPEHSYFDLGTPIVREAHQS